MVTTEFRSGSGATTECERQAASHQVGVLPELLEMILLQLPLPDILLAQRVSHTWKRTIEGSAHLQQALFFRSAKPSIVVPSDGRPHSRDCRDAAECVSNERGSRTVNDHATGLTDHQELAINPLLSRLPWLVDQKSSKPRDHRKPSFHSQSASWRKLLASQPAVAGLVVDEKESKHWHQVRASDCALGLTLNDMQSHVDAFHGTMRPLWPAGTACWRIYDIGLLERLLQYSAEEILEMISYSTSSGGSVFAWEWEKWRASRGLSKPES